MINVNNRLPRAVTTITPQRISFVGGGTDLPSFYKEHEGGVLTGRLPCLAPAERGARSTRTAGRRGLEVEVNILGNPIGKQDQYAAAFGALAVTLSKLIIPIFFMLTNNQTSANPKVIFAVIGHQKWVHPMLYAECVKSI